MHILGPRRRYFTTSPTFGPGHGTRHPLRSPSPEGAELQPHRPRRQPPDQSCPMPGRWTQRSRTHGRVLEGGRTCTPTGVARAELLPAEVAEVGLEGTVACAPGWTVRDCSPWGLFMRESLVGRCSCRDLLALAVLLSFACCDGCEKKIEKNWVGSVGRLGSPSTAGGTVVAFLRARQEGHSGEEYWREAVAPYPRMGDTVPIAPRDWKLMHVESGPRDSWVLLRFRVESTTHNGQPIEKLWDFCLNNTVKGFRIAAALDAEDKNIEVCEATLAWKKYDYEGASMLQAWAARPQPGKGVDSRKELLQAVVERIKEATAQIKANPEDKKAREFLDEVKRVAEARLVAYPNEEVARVILESLKKSGQGAP